MIGIIIGHTRKASGAYSATLGESEYFWNTDLANRIKALNEKNVFIETRDEGGISGAYARALKKKPSLLIELHFNSADTKATGTETLYADSGDDVGVREVVLAKLVNDAMVQALGLRDRGIKKLMPGGRGYGNVAQTKSVPSILIEPFFGDNPKDAKSAQKNKQQLAEAIYGAAVKWGKV